MVAQRVLLESDALHGSNFRRALPRVPGTWHLAEILPSGEPRTVCGEHLGLGTMSQPGRNWHAILGGYCHDCEREAGDAARAQAAGEE
jgi:hypothetical protein